MERRKTRLITTLVCALMILMWMAPAAGAQEYPADYPMDRWIVGFKDAPGELKSNVDTPAARAVQVRAAGAEVMLDLSMIKATAIRAESRVVEALRNNPAVEYVVRDEPRFMLAQTTPYGITSVQADQVPLGPHSRTVCVIDSGYDLGHEDLTTSNVSGFDGNLPWDQDGDGHGTHVTGTVAALNNSVGVVGVAPGVDLYIVRVFGDNGLWAFSSSLVFANERCRDAGANVINMSIGCPGGCNPSPSDAAAYQQLWDEGILIAAAAGNDGNSNISYPASYDTIISVAAIDEADAHASFSQTNQFVELAAPGVLIDSTVPRGTGATGTATVAGTNYAAIPLTDSPNATGSGALVDCGLGDVTCTGVGGAVCLIERGSVTFAEKALNCQAGGGDAAIIFNNATGNFGGTLDGAAVTIPVVSLSQADGQFLRANEIGSATTVSVFAGDYAINGGTSMASPHVAGAAALLWTYDTSWTNAQIRNCLQETAVDLGDPGRDDLYGWGKIQVQAALDGLQNGTCGSGPPPPPPPVCAAIGASCSSNSDCCSNKCRGKRGAKTCR